LKRTPSRERIERDADPERDYHRGNGSEARDEPSGGHGPDCHCRRSICPPENSTDVGLIIVVLNELEAQGQRH
jgi:hypothetical protein